MNTNLNLNKLQIQQYEKQQKIERKNEITCKICTALRNWQRLNTILNAFKRNFELKE